MALYDNRSIAVKRFTMFGVELYGGLGHCAPVLGASELLSLLRERGVSNADIARTLGLPSSRVSEMYAGKRRLQLDEAKRLVEEYKIEETINPLNGPIARLLVLHAAARLGARVHPEDPEVEELAQDFQALSRFAANPKVRGNVDAFEGFLQGLRLSQGRISAA